MTALPNFFNWRKAMQKSDLHPHSRLILHTIGCYMNVADEIAWPSIERLVEETGLSRSSVCKYLDAAVKAGWLEKWRRRQPGEQWAQNHYRLAVPDGVVRVHVAEVAGLLQSPSHGRDDTQMLDSKAAANGLGPYHGRNAEQGPQDGLDDSGEGMPERDFGGIRSVARTLILHYQMLVIKPLLSHLAMGREMTFPLMGEWSLTTRRRTCDWQSGFSRAFSACIRSTVSPTWSRGRAMCV